VHGCMGAWVHGCMGAWVHGYIGAWVHGNWVYGVVQRVVSGIVAARWCIVVQRWCTVVQGGAEGGAGWRRVVQRVMQGGT
jgi:hypothetical protein